MKRRFHVQTLYNVMTKGICLLSQFLLGFPSADSVSRGARGQKTAQILRTRPKTQQISCTTLKDA